MKNTKKRINVLVFLLIFSVCVNSNVPDTTKSSAKLSNILVDPKNVDRLDKIAQGIEQTSKHIMQAAKEGGVKEYFDSMKPNKEEIKGKLQGMVVRYHNSKGFIPFMKTLQEDILAILQVASDRIDMWRTTLPTIQGYGHATLVLANQTVQVFKDFKIEDLWDIDRKWSRKMEKSVMSNIYNIRGFMGFLWRIGQSKNTEDYFYYFSNRYMPQTTYADSSNPLHITILAIIESEELAAMGLDTNGYDKDSILSEGRAFLFHELPKKEITTGIQSLISIKEIFESAQRREEDENGYFKDNYILDVLNNVDATYLDEITLLAYIKQLRTDVEAQKVLLQQQQSYMSEIYARVQMTNTEKQAARFNHYTKEMGLILGDIQAVESWENNRP